jgi:hypothetical protein
MNGIKGILRDAKKIRLTRMNRVMKKRRSPRKRAEKTGIIAFPRFFGMSAGFGADSVNATLSGPDFRNLLSAS